MLRAGRARLAHPCSTPAVCAGARWGEDAALLVMFTSATRPCAGDLLADLSLRQ
jgi:hypothetical protein